MVLATHNNANATNIDANGRGITICDCAAFLSSGVPSK